MAGATLAQLRAICRRLLAQPNIAGRFPDIVLNGNINLALHQVMLAVEWPEFTFYFSVPPGTVTVFELPKEGVTSVLRVFSNGQECAPSSQDILQGTPYGIYGGSTAPTYAPEWTLAPVTGYPVARQMSAPSTAMSVPYFLGQEPTWFLKGQSQLVVLPPPAPGTIVSMDVYPAIIELTNDDDTCPFPLFFGECIAMRALVYSFFEQGPVASQQLTLTTAGFKEQKDILIEWKRKLTRNLPNPTILHTSPRTYYTGPPRWPQSRSRMGG